MNEQRIHDYFREKGLNEYGIAGLMGNLFAESGLNPWNLQNSYEDDFNMSDAAYVAAVDNGTYKNFVNDKAGFGIAQWTFWKRKENLLDFARAVGKSIGDLDMQLDFLAKEMCESFPSVWRTLHHATSVLEASNAVLLRFERPADQSVSVQNKRAGYGQMYYNKFAINTDFIMEELMPMTAVERLIATAKAEVGYMEKKTNAQLEDKTANAGSGNWTKYAAFLDGLGVYNGKKNGYAWCDVFVDWCLITTFGLDIAMKMTNQPMGGYGAGCTSSASYYKSAGRFHKDKPQPGDQIFFTNASGSGMAHTGLVVEVKGGRVYTIEGNTSSASGVVANGGMVAEKSYALNYNRIGGYGRPDWDLVEEEEEMNIDKIIEEMTPAQAQKVVSKARAELQDNDANSYSETARTWAVRTGLIAGGDSTEFNGMWQDYMTREQLVTVLHRFAQMMGKA